MKNGRFILPEKLQGKQGRTLLAVGIGLLAMVLILLSELFPTRQTTAAAGEKLDTAAYQTQLEQRLETLVSQMSGAGKTTVMVTLETGEESVYAVDTQSGNCRRRIHMSCSTTVPP